MKKWKIAIPTLIVLALLLCSCSAFMGPKEYTVSFMNEDGTAIDTTVYEEGNQLVVPEDPEKEGHNFAGWALEGENEVFDFSAEGATTVSKDMNFVAVFTAKEYTIKFMAANSVDVVSSETIGYGSAFAVPEAPELTGYTFVGWIKQGETAVVDFDAEGATQVKGNAVYVAKYDKVQSKIRFTDHDGSELKTLTHYYMEYFTVPESPVREGYSFLGWALAGGSDLYDFDAEGARLVGVEDIVFVAIYDKLETVTGTLKKVSGEGFPAEVTIIFGEHSKTVAVAPDGSFTTQLPAGEYSVTVELEGYKCLVNSITVTEGGTKLGVLKMQQTLTKDGISWWAGSTWTESGNSVTIEANPGNVDSSQELNIGKPIENATSWKVSAKIAPGATFRRGFTIAPINARNHETLFLWIEDGTAGFYSWSTYADQDGAKIVWDYTFPSELANKIQAEGCELTLIATNINGAGTGWLSLYVDDTLVMQMENTFVGTGDRTQAGDKIDLGNVVVSLAAIGQGNKVTFSDYYYTVNTEKALTLGTVTGKVTKLDETEIPASIRFEGGKVRKTVAVNEDGTFTATLPVGDYKLTSTGYKGAVDSICVTAGTQDLGTIPLMLALTADPMSWWAGSTWTESGNSVTIEANPGNVDSSQELNIGKPIENATSWKVSAKIAPGATFRRGFTIAPINARNHETLFLWIEDGTAGFCSWSTYADQDGAKIVWDYTFPSELADKIQAEGCELTLIATNINGAGTGWLSLYVDDTLVMQLENTFVGTGDRTQAGDKIDLGNVVVSLAAIGQGNRVTFSDYYYTVNTETDLVVGTVTGKVTKLDGTASPASIRLEGGKVRKTVAVNEDGTFTVTLPVGDYKLTSTGYKGAVDSITIAADTQDIGTIVLLQALTKDGISWWAGSTWTESGNSVTIEANPGNADSSQELNIGKPIENATSWKVSAKIAPGATFRRGFTIAPINARNHETLFLWIEDGTAGFCSWSTYADQDGAKLVWNYTFPSELADKIQADGCELTLIATNINGAGTGWLSLYVDDTLVMQLENTFVGTGDRTQAGDKIDLGNVVVSLAAIGQGNRVTFSDYYYTVNTETDLAVGTVTGKVTKLDGTALPASFKLTGGKVKKTVAVNADGTFTATVPVGDYSISSVTGYRSSVATVSITEGEEITADITLLQKLSDHYKWWGGGTYVESGNSVTITGTGDNNGTTYEVMIGDAFTSATSWKVSAHVTKSEALAQSGFSVGTADGGGAMLTLWVDNWNAGIYTCGTFADENGKNYLATALSEEAKAAVAAEGGFTLTMVAEGINGPSTGIIALYVNDIQVLVLDNSFVTQASVHGPTGVAMDLGNAHISLVGKYMATSTTFTDYYMITNCETPLELGTVTGTVVKLDGTTANSVIKLSCGQIIKSVTADENGNFSVTLPLGTYAVSADGYRSATATVTVAEGTTEIGELKFLQTLTRDMGWWDGGSLAENGNSATVTTASSGNGDNGIEYKVGSSISNAASWTISAYIEAGATGRRGFSFTPDNGLTGTIFFFIEDGCAGYYSWGTYKDGNNATNVWSYTFDAALVEDGCLLKLVASEINGAGTGVLSLYVDDVLVMQIDNSFVGTGDRSNSGEAVDLANVILCLAVRGQTVGATYTDYFTTCTN